MKTPQRKFYMEPKWLGAMLATLIFITGLPLLVAFAFAEDNAPSESEMPKNTTNDAYETPGDPEGGQPGNESDGGLPEEGIEGEPPDVGDEGEPPPGEGPIDGEPPEEGIGGGAPGEDPGGELPGEGDEGEPPDEGEEGEPPDEGIEGEPPDEEIDDPDEGEGILPEPPIESPPIHIDATIDLSESTKIDLKSTLGYEITGTSGHTYSDRKPQLHDDPLAGPSYAADTNGGLNFYANASGKTFRIVQSGVRGAPATKNGTLVVPFIHIMPGVTNVTLILEAIDLSENISTGTNGSILVDTTSTATLLLGEDAENPDITGSYVRGSIYVAPGATLIIDSANSQGVGDPSGRLTVTPLNSDHAAIGGSITYGLNAGSIIINGGTVSATQNLATVTGAAVGAAIGGAGLISSTNVAGSGTVTINGGVVTAATTGHGAAIGGGGSSKGSTGSTGAVGVKAGAGSVTINGGVVNATNSNRGAAIGGGGVYGYSSLAGDGNVTINGGVVNAVNTGYGAAIGGGASLDYDNVGAGNLGYGGGCTISITGGTVTATGNKGAGVGAGQVGFQGHINNRSIKIGEYANLKAYSSGIDTIDSNNKNVIATARPAIDVSAIPGDGKYFVNARLKEVIAGNIAAKLELLTLGGGVIDTLSLPANYRCFAYSAGVSRTDNIHIYNAATEALIGSVKHDDADGSFEIFSVNTLNGYIAHGNANEALLPVVFSTEIPLPQRYHVYQGTPESGSLINTRKLLADAVALCALDNTLYTIVATENDSDMAAGGAASVNIYANKVVKLMSKSESQGTTFTVTMRGGARHFNVHGTLTLENIILDGWGTGGGVYVSAGGSLTLQSGAVIQNCLSANDGGGIYTTDYADIHIGAGAVFSGNAASDWLDLGLSQALYESVFPTIFSPYGQYYSAPSNNPVNNYDINVLRSTVTVYYIDDVGASLAAPPPVSGTSKAYRVPAFLPFELDGKEGRTIPAIDGYEFVDWAIGGPAATEGNTSVSLPGVPSDVDIYLIYEEIVTTTVTVSQMVDGAFANMERPFLFTIYFYTDELGDDPLPLDTAFTYEGGVTDGAEAEKPADGELLLDSGGKDTFSLTHGQTLTIKGIPVGVYVRIAMEIDPKGNYSASFKDSADVDNTSGHDTGARLLGWQPRTFGFVNAMKTITPSGVAAGPRDSGASTALVAAVLLSAIFFIYLNHLRISKRK